MKYLLVHLKPTIKIDVLKANYLDKACNVIYINLLFRFIFYPRKASLQHMFQSRFSPHYLFVYIHVIFTFLQINMITAPVVVLTDNLRMHESE